MAANLDELKQIPEIINTQRKLGLIDEPIIEFFYGKCKLRFSWVYKLITSIYLLCLCWGYAVLFAFIFSKYFG